MVLPQISIFHSAYFVHKIIINSNNLYLFRLVHPSILQGTYFFQIKIFKFILVFLTLKALFQTLD